MTKPGGDVLVLVVDRLVEAEFVDDVRALLGAARDADDLLRPLDPGDLTRRRTGGARRARDDDHVAGGDLPDVGDAEVGRHAGDAEDADGDAGGDAVGQHLHRPLTAHR